MNVKEQLVKTMRVIIQKTRITKLKHFYDIYDSLLLQIFDKSQPNHGMYILYQLYQFKMFIYVFLIIFLNFT